MEDEERRDSLLRLYQGERCEEVPLERLERVLMKAVVTEVPGAPAGVAGMVYWQGRLLVVYGPRRKAGSGAAGCLALIRGDGDLLYGMVADEIAGGETLDTLYG